MTAGWKVGVDGPTAAGRRRSQRSALLASARRLRAAVVALMGVALLVGCAMQIAPHTRHSLTGPSTFHVDCSRPQQGTGTLAAPWNTVGAIAAHGPFQPGQQILLKRGSTCSGQILPTGSGRDGDPIVLGAYGEGARPTVDGGATPDGTGTVQLTNEHDWVVQDLDVTNFDPAGPSDAMRAGILVTDDGGGMLADIVIRSNTVRRVTSSPGYHSADPHKFGGIAVLVRQQDQALNTFSNVSITGNSVDHVGRTGITVWSDAWPAAAATDVSVTRNDLSDIEGDSIVLWGVDGGVIDHNTSEAGGNLPPCPRCSFTTAVNTASAGIWPVMSTRILMQYNEVSGEGAGGGDGEGFDIDESTSDVVMQGNYAHENAGGGVLVCGVRSSDIRYNVFESDGGGEITFSCPVQRDGVRIFNNDIYLGPQDTGQVVRRTNSAGTDPVLFSNNIVFDLDAGGYAWASPVIASHNLFAGLHPLTEPADADALRVDPALLQAGAGGFGLGSAAGYALSPSSPAARSGLALADAGATDYLGRPVDAAVPDRGAFARTGIPEPAARPLQLRATRSGADVVLEWSGSRGDAWRLERSAADGPWLRLTGLLTRGAFTDAGAPSAALRYRVVAVGRDSETVAGATTVGAAMTTAAPSITAG